MECSATAIEDIILSNDHRGIHALRARLPERFCTDAASYLLSHSGVTLITTGFYIPEADAPETDGPNGALAIGDALLSLGHRVVYVSGAPLSTFIAEYLAAQGVAVPVVTFPLLKGKEANHAFTESIIAQYAPSALLSVERCSPTVEGAHLTMHGTDISEQTPCIELLFKTALPSIGIGDGGNEIGMGAFASAIQKETTLPDSPAVIGCDKVVIASTSNWGAYGVVAALSVLTGKPLLPTAEEELQRLQYFVSKGVVDGATGKNECTVDGFSADETAEILKKLHAHVAMQ